MQKRMFIPFRRSQPEARSLGLVLKTPADAKGGPNGEHKGFSDSEYVWAPEQGSQNSNLAMLKDESDQLYITGHGTRGMDYLTAYSVTQKFNSESPQKATVGAKDVVEQLMASGLPTETKCKIKLWVCEGAGPAKSFAKSFSKEMFEKKYKQCKIFGYTLTLGQQYELRDEKYRKVANKGKKLARSAGVRLRFDNGRIVPEQEDPSSYNWDAPSY